LTVFGYHWDGSTECAYGQSTDKPPNSELLPDAFGCHLDDNTDDEYYALYCHSMSPPKRIGDAIPAPVSGGRKGNRTSKAHGAPAKAPTSVPMDKRETMSPERTVVKWHVLTSPGTVQVAKRRLKSSMIRMSLIWPVS
jgi:hypothetical protein